MKKLLQWALMFVIFCPVLSFAQEKTVTGKVTDDVSGAGLPGVSVLLKNTPKGVNTDANGNFSIAAKASDVLVFSFVGFDKQEVTIGNKMQIEVTLKTDTKNLEEVVVVGYGTQKKANVTGSMSSFSAKELDQRPIARVDQALVGQLAGVTVKQTTGLAGRGFSVQVRGTGAISASNEPLYVIDGFPLESAGQNAAGGFSQKKCYKRNTQP